MSKSSWTVVWALVGVALAVLLLGLAGYWVLYGTAGGMMGTHAPWVGMMGRWCPWCGGGYGLLGGLMAVLMIGMMIVVPLGLLILCVLGLVWLVRLVQGSGKPRPLA